MANPGRWDTTVGLVGRESEVFRLGAAWGAAARGRPALILLAGAAGVGKTRLAAETVRLAGRTGGTVLTARCDEPDRVYEIVTDLLRTPADREPVLLVLDDLHNADPATVELLHRLARGAADRRTRLLVVATVRPAEGDAALRALEDVATRIDVRPLPPKVVRADAGA
jgi:predicted ATPase